MKPFGILLLFTGCLVAIGTVSTSRAGVVLSNDVSFANATGTHPSCALITGADGNFYGTAYYGGLSDAGTLFQLTPAGALKSVSSFNRTNGANPIGGLLQLSNGLFYGTASTGGSNGGIGYGTVFQADTNGGLSALFSFNNTNGAAPQAGLLLGVDGLLYGTTGGGGTNGGYGTVFKTTTNGALTVLFSFNNTNGANPCCALVPGTNGAFYGTCNAGGSNGFGTVFRITTNGGFSDLFDFNMTNGANPYAGLTLGKDGNFYGTTTAGGTNGGFGTVFKITPAGALTSLCSFNSTNGNNPNGALMQGPDGNFYGTTELGGTTNDGTVFAISPSGALTPLASFYDPATGSLPAAALVQGADGNFYGTAHDGGSNGLGTVFRLGVPLPPVIRGVTQSNSTLTITWTSVAGQSYAAEFTTNLSPTSWTNLGGTNLATSGLTKVLDPMPATNGQRFYRVVSPQ